MHYWGQHVRNIHKGYTKGNVKDNALETTQSANNSLNSVLDIPVNIIKQKYNIEFSVNELVIDDKYIDVSLDNVPIEMKTLLKHKSESFKTYYINKNINKAYISFDQFVKDLAMPKIKKDYKTELDFYIKGYKIYDDKHLN